MWLRKLLLFLETKNLKKPKIWTFGFFRFYKKPKNLGFLKATSTALLINVYTDCPCRHLTQFNIAPCIYSVVRHLYIQCISAIIIIYKTVIHTGYTNKGVLYSKADHSVTGWARHAETVFTTVLTFELNYNYSNTRWWPRWPTKYEALPAISRWSA